MTISYEYKFGPAANVAVTVQIPTTALHSRNSNDVEVFVDYGGKEARGRDEAKPPQRIYFITSEESLMELMAPLVKLIDGR